MARIRWLKTFEMHLAEKRIYLDTILTMLVSFVIFFVATRYVRSEDPPSLTIKNVTVHHFLWVKVFLIPLIISTLIWRGDKATYFFAWLYGFCLALDFDEIGMQLHLTPDDGKSVKGFWMIFIFLFLVLCIRLTAKFISNRIHAKKEQNTVT